MKCLFDVKLVQACAVDDQVLLSAQKSEINKWKNINSNFCLSAFLKCLTMQ